MGKNEAFFEKKSFGFFSDTDTKIGPWFRFQIPKLGFGFTLIQTAELHVYIFYDIYEPVYY